MAELKLVVALFFSFNVLYLVTCAFIMLEPEDLDKVDDQDTDTHRVESAVIVNSLVLGVLGLMLAARLFSWVGERMVEMLYQLIHAEPGTVPTGQQARYQQLVQSVQSVQKADGGNSASNLSSMSNAPMHQQKPLLKVHPTLLYSSR